MIHFNSKHLMNKLLISGLFFLAFFGKIKAQQWIDEQYQFVTQSDIRYGSAYDFTGELKPLHMDIYMPVCDISQTTHLKPLIVWFHGGAFIAGNKNDTSIKDMCQTFASRGYVTASVEYRLGMVSDDRAWNCNYPDYSCVFAADSAEWARAYYRSIQDGKGALRFLINHYQNYGIDTSNIFLAGESAGSFIALGIGLMDVSEERPKETYATTAVPLPNPQTIGTNGCAYNSGKVFTGTSISRPDLGGIDGTIEPTNIHFTIKGIGNIYGGMMSDLLKKIPTNKPKPAIYSFHRPCDMVVPIDSNFVFWGLSWCFTHGYNCYGVQNNHVKLYGSRAFSQWNTAKNYGYTIQNEFTTVEFPYNFLLGTGSCADQVNNPCHGYDNRSLREKNLAKFFSTLVTSQIPCVKVETHETFDDIGIQVYPNPTEGKIYIQRSKELSSVTYTFELRSMMGVVMKEFSGDASQGNVIDITDLPQGIYFLNIKDNSTIIHTNKIIKY